MKREQKLLDQIKRQQFKNLEINVSVCDCKGKIRMQFHGWKCTRILSSLFNELVEIKRENFGSLNTVMMIETENHAKNKL